MESQVRKGGIRIVLNSLGDKVVETESRGHGKTIVFDENADMYLHVELVKKQDINFEELNNNGAVGSQANQVAAGDHDHEVGDLSLIFENKLL